MKQALAGFSASDEASFTSAHTITMHAREHVMKKSLKRVLAEWRVLRAVAIIVAAVPCAASAQTPTQQAPTSAAPQPAQPLTDFQETQLYGCWKHAGVRPVANQWTGDAILCFRKDRTVYYHYISPEHGEADLFDWRFIPDDKLVIDEQSCDIWNGTTAEALFLGRCLYMGAWIRQCAQMNDEGTACPGAPPTQQVLPSAPLQSAQPSSDFHESQFYGCWKRTGSRSITNQRVGYSTLCFRKDRTAYYSYVSAEHGGEDLFEWQFIPNDALSINEQSCRVLPGTSADNLFLARCLYMGAWVQQCARLNNDGTGCPTRDQ